MSGNMPARGRYVKGDFQHSVRFTAHRPRVDIFLNIQSITYNYCIMYIHSRTAGSLHQVLQYEGLYVYLGTTAILRQMFSDQRYHEARHQFLHIHLLFSFSAHRVSRQILDVNVCLHEIN